MRRKAVLCAALLAALPALGKYRSEFHQTYGLASNGRVSLDNLNGDVRIFGWDRDEVEVQAVKSAAIGLELAEAQIDVESGDGFVAIRTKYDIHNQADPASVEYRVSVPRTARLDEIRLVNGTVEITGVAGQVKASSVNGAVRAQKLAGDTVLSTVNGELQADFESMSAAHAISLRSTNGPIVLTMPFDARAEFHATNVAGGILNAFGFPVRRGPVSGTQLDAMLRGGGTRIRLHNVNGCISIVPMAGGRRIRFT